MRKFSLHILICLFILATGCNKTGIKNGEEANADVSFEDFVALFPSQPAAIKEINAENGSDFGESPEIESAYFQSFLQQKPYLNHLGERLTFSKNPTDNQDIIYRVVTNISYHPCFYSLVISANLEGDPTHEWAYYLLHYAKDGSYIDGILLSYRNSYISEEATEEILQSEYRYVRFLPKNQLQFTDINYDNTLKSSLSTDNNTQYFRESWYQIEENGTFKKLKMVERNKNDAKP